MDLPDEDRDGAGRARLLADEIGAEAVVLLGAAFDKLAGRGKAGEFGGVARGLRRRRGRRHQACGDQRREDHSTLRLRLRIRALHFASSLSMSAAYSSGVERSGSPPSE